MKRVPSCPFPIPVSVNMRIDGEPVSLIGGTGKEPTVPFSGQRVTEDGTAFHFTHRLYRIKLTVSLRTTGEDEQIFILSHHIEKREPGHNCSVSVLLSLPDGFSPKPQDAEVGKAHLRGRGDGEFAHLYLLHETAKSEKNILSAFSELPDDRFVIGYQKIPGKTAASPSFDLSLAAAVTEK